MIKGNTNWSAANFWENWKKTIILFDILLKGKYVLFTNHKFAINTNHKFVLAFQFSEEFHESF